MFRNTRGGGRDILPTSGNGRSGGGGSMYGAARASKPALSKSFIATIFWALVSLALFAGGWTYCSRRLESTTVKCDMKGCQVAELTNGVSKVLTIPRLSMIRGELVRVKNGAIVDPSKMRRSAQRKLGYTYAVVYTEPDSEDDDDESYDSFEDDDDSYDSYDDDQDSSEDDDDEDDDRPRSAGQRANTPPAKKPAGTSAKSSKFTPKPLSSAEKQAAIDKKEADRKAATEKKKAQRERFAEERRNQGKAPVREPDEQKGRRPERWQAAQRPMEDFDYLEHDSDDRFPGDAGTMRDKNRDQIAEMEAAEGMAANSHRERGQKAYEEASRKHMDRHKLDQQTRQIGNNLHDRRKASPDDPDNNRPPPRAEQEKDERPKLERGEAQKDLSGAKDAGEGEAEDAAEDTAEDTDEEIKNLEDRLDQLKKGAKTKKAGGRTVSSVGGLESVDEDQLLGEDEARREILPADGEAEEEVGALEGGQEYETLGEFMHAGAAGARRKLLAWKNRVKNVDTPAAKRTREEIDRDAAKARESHRRGHGHHQKRPKKVAETVANEVGAKAPPKRTSHHHKAFHHKEEVPAEKRHHVHPGFHHGAEEKKIEHGWKHQNRQWHGKGELKKLATSYNLGRAKARKRKEAIDSYVSRRSHAVDFVDSKKWRAVGLWMMIVGFISASFCLIVGNFQPRPKTKKVS